MALEGSHLCLRVEGREQFRALDLRFMCWGVCEFGFKKSVNMGLVVSGCVCFTVCFFVS